MSKAINLPISSYDKIEKIIKAYGHQSGPASLEEIAKLSGVGRTVVSGNNKFLVDAGLLTPGSKKGATDLGKRLGRALVHEQVTDVRNCWREVVSGNDVISGLVTTVRIKKGMTPDQLSSHALYVFGQDNTPLRRTGANTIVEILKGSGLVEPSEGKLVVTQPNEEDLTSLEEGVADAGGSSIKSSGEETTEGSAEEEPGRSGDHQVSGSLVPQIAINIQLHLPATSDSDVYENLFSALKKHLMSREA